MGKLKSEVVNKEAKIHEVELTLEVEHRKIEAYEDHIRHLNQQLKELQDQTCLVVQEKSSVFMKLKSNLQADENINTQLMKGKSRLRLINCRVCNTRPFIPGCAGCAMAHPDFDGSVNPISTRGGQIMPTLLLLAHPDFQTFQRPCNIA